MGVIGKAKLPEGKLSPRYKRCSYLIFDVFNSLLKKRIDDSFVNGISFGSYVYCVAKKSWF